MIDSELKQQEELLNCPCCNGGTFEEVTKSPMGIRYYAVVCKDCGLSTKFYCAKSKDKARNAWNTRAKDPSHQLLVDALEAILPLVKQMRRDEHLFEHQNEAINKADEVLEAVLKAARGE